MSNPTLSSTRRPGCYQRLEEMAAVLSFAQENTMVMMQEPAGIWVCGTSSFSHLPCISQMSLSGRRNSGPRTTLGPKGIKMNRSSEKETGCMAKQDQRPARIRAWSSTMNYHYSCCYYGCGYLSHLRYLWWSCRR